VQHYLFLCDRAQGSAKQGSAILGNERVRVEEEGFPTRVEKRETRK